MCSQPMPPADEMVATALPDGMRSATRRRQVPGRHEVDEHRVEPRERRPGQPRAVEERIHPTAEVGHRGVDRVRVAEVHLPVARDVRRRFLQVEDVHFCAELEKVADQRRAHPCASAPAYEDSLVLVTPDARQCRPFPCVLRSVCFFGLVVSCGLCALAVCVSCDSSSSVFSCMSSDPSLDALPRMSAATSGDRVLSPVSCLQVYRSERLSLVDRSSPLA